MAKTSFAEKLKSIFGMHSAQDDAFYDDLTDTLIEGDIGAKTAMEIVDELQKKCRELHISDARSITDELKKMLLAFVKTISFIPEDGKTNVFMVLGVNGVGKTTSVAKMAKWYAQKKYQVIMAAADTFRAAAVDQIDMHGSRLGIRVVKHQMGSDPSAVVFDACDANTGELVINTTERNLHNKANLVNELKKIDRIATTKASPGCYKKILVVDATTGQNAVRQAEVFNEAVGIDAVVLTKYDSTAKGGAAISIGKELSIPVMFICTGEKYDDIAPFNPDKYVDECLGN